MNSTNNIILHGAVTAGVGRLTLTRPQPQPTAKGSVDVTLDLTVTAENLVYLQGRWGGAAFDNNPKSRATFGIYRGGNAIHMRELFF